MTWFSLQKLTATQRTDEFPIAHGHLAADRDVARAALQFPTFEGAVVDVHRLGLCRNRAAIIGIEYHQIGVGTGLNRSFSREKIELFGDLSAGRIDEGVKVDL